MLLCDNLDLTIRNTEPSKYTLTKLDFTGANGTFPIESAHGYTVYTYNGDIQNNKFVSPTNNGLLTYFLNPIYFGDKMGNHWQLDLVFEGILPEFMLAAANDFSSAFMVHSIDNGYGTIYYHSNGVTWGHNTTISPNTSGTNYLKVASVNGFISIYLNGNRVDRYNTNNIPGASFGPVVYLGRFGSGMPTESCSILGFRLYRGIPDTNDASTCSIPTLPL